MALFKILPNLSLGFQKSPIFYLPIFRNKRLSTLPNNIVKPNFNSYLNHIFQRYENIIGLTDVKFAQARVIQAEKKFVDTQEKRRERQRQIQQLQSKLKDIHLELDKTVRGEDRYLHLITQEHAIIREERSLLEEFRGLEKDERDFFSALSLAVRESHEQERAQAERTKYWSLIGSVCGAIIGILGTTINNRIRMKELRQLVQESTIVSDTKQLFLQQQKKVDDFLADLRSIAGFDKETSNNNNLVKNDDSAIILSNEALESMQVKLLREMQEIKVLLTSQLVQNSGNTIENAMVQSPVSVYFGNDLEHIVNEAEKNLEWKMKINSLATVAAFYGLFAVTVPLILQMFKGS